VRGSPDRAEDTDRASDVEGDAYPSHRPQGNVTTYKVGDAVKRLNEVKTGYQVVLWVTDALAILVESPMATRRAAALMTAAVPLGSARDDR
jgi:hypothetical protein